MTISENPVFIFQFLFPLFSFLAIGVPEGWADRLGWNHWSWAVPSPWSNAWGSPLWGQVSTIEGPDFRKGMFPLLASPSRFLFQLLLRHWDHSNPSGRCGFQDAILPGRPGSALKHLKYHAVVLYLCNAYIMWSVQAFVLCQSLSPHCCEEERGIISPVWYMRGSYKVLSRKGLPEYRLAGLWLFAQYFTASTAADQPRTIWILLQIPGEGNWVTCERASLVRHFLFGVSQNSSPLSFPLKALVLPSAWPSHKTFVSRQPLAFSYGHLFTGAPGCLGHLARTSDRHNQMLWVCFN